MGYQDHSAADPRGHPVPRNCDWGRCRRKELRPWAFFILQLPEAARPTKAQESGDRQPLAELSSCALSDISAAWMWGLRDHRTFSLGHQRHFLWHDASWFTISSSSFPWLRRSRSGSPGASICVEQEFGFQKLRSGLLLNGGWQQSQAACFIMCALFVFHTKWAETLKLISDSSQNQMATLSLGSQPVSTSQRRSDSWVC